MGTIPIANNNYQKKHCVSNAHTLYNAALILSGHLA